MQQVRSRRNQSTTTDVNDHCSEHENGERLDSKKKATPTPSLTPMQVSRGQVLRVPRSKIVSTLKVHLRACPTIQRSRGGNPVKRTLPVMKFLQTSVARAGRAMHLVLTSSGTGMKA